MRKVYTDAMEEAPWDMDWLATDRIQNLTDGVFAIAMTILVFNLTTPIDFDPTGILGILYSLGPQFFAYFLSFAALATFWVGHHNHSAYIRRLDRPFLWINIFFLSFIVLIPFSTGMLGHYYKDPLAIIVYGTNLLICGVGMYWYWSHATTHHLLVDADLDEQKIITMKDRVLIPLIILVLTMGGALISPALGLLMFLGIVSLAITPTSTDHLFKILAHAVHKYLKV